MTRIAYFADDAWAVPALNRLLKLPDVEVVLVVERRQPTGTAVADAARANDLPLACPQDINDPAFHAGYARLQVDLGVSHSYDQIFRQPFIDAHPAGIINAHTALLPCYRGRNPLTWALIAGEPVVGVSVHYVDAGIDTGDILHQVAVPVGPDDPFGLVRDRIGRAAAAAIAEAVRLITTGTAPAHAIAQDQLGPGFYCSRRGPGDERIDWHGPAQTVHDFVRALADPGPGARTVDTNGREWAIRATQRLERSAPHVGRPGTVIGTDPTGVIVKTGDTALRIINATADPSTPAPGGGVPRLPIGHRFT